MSQPTTDEFASAEVADEEPSELSPEVPICQLVATFDLQSDSETTRSEREDRLAADLREFFRGRGVQNATLHNSLGEDIDLTGEPPRDGV